MSTEIVESHFSSNDPSIQIKFAALSDQLKNKKSPINEKIKKECKPFNKNNDEKLFFVLEESRNLNALLSSRQ